MIKKPWAIYPIALWILFQQAYAITIPLKMGMMSLGFVPNLPHEISGLILIAEIIILVSLVRLRTFGRVTSIVLISTATIVSSWLFLQLIFPSLSPSSSTTYPARTYVLMPSIIAVDISIIWYLARKRFGDLCKQYQDQGVKERTTCDLAQANADLKKNFIWPK